MPRPTSTPLRLALATAGALAAAPAGAQFYGGYLPPPPPPYGYNAPPPFAYEPYPAPRRLSPDSVVDRLEEIGYEDVSRPRFTGTLYLVEATSPGGYRVRIVVDAIRGAILDRQALGGAGFEDGPLGRRYSARPYGPYPGEVVPPSLEPGVPAPDSRGLARPPSARGESALPRPADPRLAPSPNESREARAPSEVAPRPGAPGAAPYGVNPEVQPRRAPAQQARRPAETGKPAAARPSDVPKAGSAEGGPKPPATAEARPAGQRPVRVIEGVTPLNSGGGSGSSTALDNLPAPPPVPQPGVE